MFKKIINTALLASLLCAACKQHKAVEIPPGVLGKEAFANLLADFALAESAANLNIKATPVFKVDSVYAFDPLHANKVRQAQYDSTIGFYSQHTELYLEVYQLVLAELNALKTRRDSLQAHVPKKTIDSSKVILPKHDSLSHKVVPKKRVLKKTKAKKPI